MAAHNSQADCGNVVVAWDNVAGDQGFVRVFSGDPPWSFQSPAMQTGADGIVRSLGNTIYHLSRRDGVLTLIDADSWSVIQSIDLDAAREPRDVLPINDSLAYVTRGNATHLLRVNPQTGETTEVADLTAFADDDGIPDMEMMAAFENHLFIQIRRDNDFVTVTPALAVFDWSTDSLVDVDPGTPGVQAIELIGTAPRNKMHVLPASRRLVVGATGRFADFGGLELIDVDSLQSLGLFVRELIEDVGQDIGGFTMKSEAEGWLAFSTDIVISSHAAPFTIANGREVGGGYSTIFYFVPQLLYCADGDQIFWPEPDGVSVLDGVTSAPLTTSPIPFPGFPTDMTFLPSNRLVPSGSSSALLVFALLVLLSSVVAARRVSRVVSR